MGLNPLRLPLARMGVPRQPTFIAVLLACLAGATGYSAAPGFLRRDLPSAALALLCAYPSLPQCDVAVIGTIIRCAVHSLRMQLLRIDGWIDVWLHVRLCDGLHVSSSFPSLPSPPTRIYTQVSVSKCV